MRASVDGNSGHWPEDSSQGHQETWGSQAQTEGPAPVNLPGSSTLTTHSSQPHAAPRPGPPVWVSEPQAHWTLPAAGAHRAAQRGPRESQVPEGSRHCLFYLEGLL